MIDLWILFVDVLFVAAFTAAGLVALWPSVGGQ